MTGNTVELNDGVFEVTLVKKPANLLEMNNIIKALVDKRVHSDAFRSFKTSRITIESDQEVSWTLDGEFGGNHYRAVIENKNGALEIRIPQ